MHRRPRKDRTGGETTRTPETWEEAHQVVLEMEGMQKGNVATNDVLNSGTVGRTREDKSGGVDAPNDKGKGEGKGISVYKDRPDGSRGECFNWLKEGN